LELSPLTLLVGTNSAGKSTILQALLLQAQAAASGVAGASYPLNGSKVSLGNFADLLWSGADQVQSDPVVTIGGELEILKDETVVRRHEDDAVPGWSWRLALGKPGPEEGGTTIVRETAVWSRDNKFSLSAQVASEASSSLRHIPPRIGVDERERDRWLFNVVGQINSDPDLSESVVGVEIIAGLPHRVLVERVAAQVLAVSWITAMDRVIWSEQVRRTRTSTPATRRVGDLKVLRTRFERAHELGDDQLAGELAERIDALRTNLLNEEREAALSEREARSSKNLDLELSNWAHADIERILAEGGDLSNATNRFYEYYMERRRGTSLPDIARESLISLYTRR
jgi:hypothetical protein